jgi:hypothetical protein
LPDFGFFGVVRFILDQYGEILLAWGWFMVVFFVLHVAWEAYKFIKTLDYVSAIQWTFLQITVPELAEQTPKSMEHAYDVWSGIHKGPDIVERYFEGYLEAWFSCELHCEPHRVRYIMVVPTAHRKFFEGVIYGQYPQAEIREVEDYSQRYNFRDLEKTFDLYGTEVVLVADDIYPIKMYNEYEDSLAEEDKYIDPHQSLVEAYTNIREGEEFWVQILIRPIDAKTITTWAKTGEHAIAEIAGTAKEEEPGIVGRAVNLVRALPGELWQAFVSGPIEPEDKKMDRPLRPVFTPLDSAKMEGITRKISRTGFKTKIRLIHIAPAGKLVKPSISTAIGAFKQFNTFHLNSLKPDDETKTNGPNYILKQSRRRFRKRKVLLYYQFRDFWGITAGQMMTAEELATLYHFPVKYLRAPAVERATSGLGAAPENLPYI